VRDEEIPNPVLKKVAGMLTKKDDEKIKSRNEKVQHCSLSPRSDKREWHLFNRARNKQSKISI
jgi:hypothetical protein